MYDPVSLWVTDSYDRAQHTSYQHDARGRVKTVARQITTPSGSPFLSARYAPNVFTKTLTYFEANQLASETSGADAPELTANGSEVDLNYGYEGVLRTVGSSYGPIVTGQTIDPLGSVMHRTFGDAAGTVADMTYDPNERLSSYYLHRTAGPWVSSAGYSAADPQTLEGDLTELSIGRDEVGNPTTMLDLINLSPWPSGAKPQSRTFQYYDDYRLKEVDASYGGGDDAFVSPYAAEVASNSAKFPALLSSPRNRVRRQTFGYDWLGNMTSSTDDANAFLDRSLGTIHNGTLAAGGPHRMLGAVSTDNQHALNVTYDAAGNVTLWTVSGAGSTLLTEYVYQWDEVGRLMTASRLDVAQGTAINEAFAYDAGGTRVLTTYPPASDFEPPVYRVEVFPSLVLEDAHFPDPAGDYDHTAATEHVYLGAGGVRAHVFQPQSALPSATGDATHMYLLLNDPGGSTAFVIDSGTGEVVERPSYLAYGAVESDFRPVRWGSFREDIRYTGHWDDAEVGLIYHGARWYAPQLARWISPDPLAVHGVSGDPNVYAYVSGSPIRFSDPIGMGGSDDPDAGQPDQQQPSPQQPSPQQPSCNSDTQACNLWNGGWQGVPYPYPTGDPSWPGVPYAVPGQQSTPQTVAQAPLPAWLTMGAAAQDPWANGSPEPFEAPGLGGEAPVEDPFAFAYSDPLIAPPATSPVPVAEPPAGWSPIELPGPAVGPLVILGAGALLVGDSSTAIDPGDYRARYNDWLVQQGRDPLPWGYQAHHRIPQIYALVGKGFSDFDFHDPSNIRGVASWEMGPEYDVHSVITTAWNIFRQDNPAATRAQVEDFAQLIDAKLGYTYYASDLYGFKVP